MKVSEVALKANNAGRNISKVASTIPQTTEKPAPQPDGVWGQSIFIDSGEVHIDSKELDFEFNIPFDCDIEPNEATITVYNLSANTIAQLKNDQSFFIKAGYGDDTGIILSGFIRKVSTSHTDCDKVTKIVVLDDQALKDRELAEISYAANVKASYILKDLINRTGLPCAVFKISHDYVYKEAEKVDGSILEAIKKYAEQCHVNVYIMGGKFYAHDIRTASQDINFKCTTDNGMIDSPEPFTETITYDTTSDDEKNQQSTETIYGFKVDMLMQYRIQVGVKVDLMATDYSGQFSVRSGEHTYDGNKLITKIEAIQ